MSPVSRIVIALALNAGSAHAQSRVYAGVVAGTATLSADAATSLTSGETAVALYTPLNGPAFNLFGGVHVSDVVSLQGNYVVNRNNLSVFSTRITAGGEDSAEERRNSTQHAAIGDVLVYFRDRQSWVRPYLSGGAGIAVFRSTRQSVDIRRGAGTALTPGFTSIAPSFRVAVGIDIRVRSGWVLRYSFSETLRSNPLSERLSPPGKRNLANFQNLFGFARLF